MTIHKRVLYGMRAAASCRAAHAAINDAIKAGEELNPPPDSVLIRLREARKAIVESNNAAEDYSVFYARPENADKDR